jgi:hypothetical protein
MKKISFWEEECRYRGKIMDAEQALVHLLEKYGWKLTCGNPGSRWMWEKEINGRVLLLVDKEIALNIEKFLHSDDEWPEFDGEEGE